MPIQAYGAHAGDKPLERMEITRRTPGPHDVQIDIAIELIRADEINGAYERLLKGDIQYRFVIDNATLSTSPRKA